MPPETPAIPTEAAPTGAPLLELLAVMDRLRSPGGCPWDAKQTHKSLVEYLIEETYETVEAIEQQDDAALIEELGDVLLQVVFHSRIGQESDPTWNIDDVARGITDKLVRRHDYVFGDATLDDSADLESTWQANKTAEKSRTSVTDGIPLAMPSLVLAAKILRRAGHGGIATTPVTEARATQARELLATAESEDDFGDVLLAIVAAGEVQGLDADRALRGSVRRFREAILTEEG